MTKTKYIVVDGEGTLLGYSKQAPAHVGGAIDAIADIAEKTGISPDYLKAYPAEIQESLVKTEYDEMFKTTQVYTSDNHVQWYSVFEGEESEANVIASAFMNIGYKLVPDNK